MALALVYLLGALVLFPKPDRRIVFGDASHHFVQLRSLVFDRDLHFQNDYVRLYGLRGGEPNTEWIFSDLTPTGHVRNYMPVGPALLWAPLYLLVAGVMVALAALGAIPAPDGFEPVFQLVPGLSGIGAATVAAVASFRMTRRYTAVPIAAAGVLATWLGSHALYYTLVSPSYSHVASMFAAGLFFAHWTATREQPSTLRFVQWGALVGLAALMRWQDGVLLAVPLVEAARRPGLAGGKVPAALGSVTAALLVFLPQMAVWTVLYGEPLTVPQGAGFMQWTSPHLLAVLVSDNHGLFSWAPLLVPATIGLVVFARKQPELALPIGIVVLVTWYVNAAVADWWAGEAFGARRFLSLFPLFALGLATWLSPRRTGRPPRSRIAVLAALIVANGLLLLQYQLFMKGHHALAPYPHGWPDMWLTRFAVPFRLLQQWPW